MSQNSNTNSNGRASVNKYPAITPRFWHGMPSRIWWPIVAKNRFNFHLSRIGFGLSISAFSPVTDLLALLQHSIHGKAIENTELAGPPVFIVGHWRSGTTLMHELLDLNNRFASPSTYQCFAPWHFLLTEPMMLRFGNFLLPKKRPMDNMRANWRLPQEDEFALVNLGAPSVYERIIFSEHPAPFQTSLNSDEMSVHDYERVGELLNWFLKALTYHSQKPLILKSPPHTGRLKLIRASYPNAKFVHMTRDPMKLFPSTMRLWQSIDAAQSMHANTPRQQLEDFVFSCLNTMYQGFEHQRADLPDEAIIDVRYEDLVAEPVETCRAVYQHLQWDDFAEHQPAISNRMDQDREYQPNQHQISDGLTNQIRDQWAHYFERYGYD